MNAWRSGEMLEVPMSEQLARAYEGFLSLIHICTATRPAS